MNKVKFVLLVSAVLLSFAAKASAGWVPTPAVDDQGRTIYVWVPGAGGPLPGNASPESEEIEKKKNQK